MTVSGSMGAVTPSLDFSRGKIGDYQAGWQVLADGMAGKASEVQTILLKLVKEHNIPDFEHAIAIVSDRSASGEPAQTAEYLVIEKHYPRQGKATLAVRITPFGKDLYVEWLHYELGMVNNSFAIIAVLVGILVACITMGLGLLIYVPLLIWAWIAGYLRRPMTHFEKQDSWAVRAVVDTCLKQAIDQSGIAKELLHEVQGNMPGKTNNGSGRFF